MPTPASFTSQIRAAVDENTAAFWKDADDIYPAMWEAEYELCAELGHPQFKTATTTVTSTSQYTKPTNLLRLEVIKYNGVKLKKVDLVEHATISESGYGGTIPEGNPVFYYEYGDTVGLYPIPNQAKTLDWYGVKRPTEITTSSTQFTVDAEFQPAIKDYVLYRMFLKDNDARSREHYARWEAEKYRLKSVFTVRKYRDQNLEVKDVNTMNSTDYGMI